MNRTLERPVLNVANVLIMESMETTLLKTEHHLLLGPMPCGTLMGIQIMGPF